MKHLDATANVSIGSAALWLTCLVAVLLAAAPALAWTQYSVDKDTGNCADCHGNFTEDPYTSLVDRQTWPGSLHDVHRQDMLGGDCNTCHTGGGQFFPVDLASSAGGGGLSPISCVGCHGRSQDGSGAGTSGYAAGLRQHHTGEGESCLPCHSDSLPANFTPATEDVLPPYYADPGTGHPAMPDDPCNPAPGYPENFGGTTIGLDNDGDGLPDEADADCAGSSTCGDGNLDPGEDCDDGNNDDGDCCAADCTFEPIDSPCDNGLFCTIDDVCDGAGTCTDGSARDCDDGDICTDDSCKETEQRCDNAFNPGNDPSCQPMCTDVDGDTYSPEPAGCGPVDCDDDDAAINPGATELCDDNVDNDCDGLIDSADPACGWTGTPEAWDGPLDNPEYAGSVTCGECHETQFATWQNTLHARMQIRPGDAQAAGFELPLGEPDVTIQSWNDVLFVVGQKWRTNYVDKTGQIQGPRWNYDSAQWDSSGDGLVPYDCGACHTTGFDPDATFEDPPGSPVPGIVGSWVEYSIGCEACHGPGAEHADSPSAGNINRIRFDWYDPDNDGTPDPVGIASAVVCGNCHYRNDHATIQTDRLNREQYNDWIVSSHASSLPLNAISTYCAKCHSPGNAVADAAEHNFTYFPPTDATHVACVSCHDPHRISNERWATLEWPPGGQQNPKNLQAAIARYRGTDFNTRTSDYEPFDNSASNELCSDCHTLQPGFRRHIDASPEDAIALMPPFNNGNPFLFPHAAHYENGYARCVDCHMHYSRESANPGDVRSHSLIPDEASRFGFSLPHYSETCGQCHTVALDCDWCHAQFGGGRFRGQIDTSPSGGPRTRRAKRGVALRD